MNFDLDHEGRGGWTSGEILNGLGDWLNQTGSADIVLLSSPGGNDALEGLPYSEAVSNINYIIDILQADNPSITIILEQMAPGRSDIMTSELTEFFTQMQQEVLNIAANKTTTTSSVMAVDMFTGFNDNLLADDVHYNEARELVKLLSQSTYRELTKDEKIKVREQLLDICKTIPSLTIFLIPGGSLLLPILIKYIPSLLPSAFNENKIDSKS